MTVIEKAAGNQNEFLDASLSKVKAADYDLVSVSAAGGNGSKNSAQVRQRTRHISQTGQAVISNKVEIDASTGGNQCQGNVGGCQIRTGEVVVLTGVENQVGQNKVQIGKEPTPTPTPSPTPLLSTSVTPIPTASSLPATPSLPLGGLELVAPPPSLSPTPLPLSQAQPEESVPAKEEQAPESLTAAVEETLRNLAPLVQTITPGITSSTTEAEKEGQVLGITQLPLTGVGLGQGQYPVSWLDLGPGVLLVVLGWCLRRLTEPSRERQIV